MLSTRLPKLPHTLAMKIVIYIVGPAKNVTVDKKTFKK